MNIEHPTSNIEHRTAQAEPTIILNLHWRERGYPARTYAANWQVRECPRSRLRETAREMVARLRAETRGLFGVRFTWFVR